MVSENASVASLWLSRCIRRSADLDPRTLPFFAALAAYGLWMRRWRETDSTRSVHWNRLAARGRCKPLARGFGVPRGATKCDGFRWQREIRRSADQTRSLEGCASIRTDL